MPPARGEPVLLQEHLHLTGVLRLELQEEYFVGRNVLNLGRIVAAGEHVKAVETHPDVRMVGVLRDAPGAAAVVDEASPGQRLERQLDVIPPGQVAEPAQLVCRHLVGVDGGGGGGDTAAHQQHADAEPLRGIEGGRGTAEIVGEGLLVDAFDVAQRLILPESAAQGADLLRAVVIGDQIGFEELHPVEAASGDDVDVDVDLINAGKIPVTETPGASYFHHADSFAMMRGGHLDVCVLGAFQVSRHGDLANWHTGEPDAIPAVGGAMDLAIGAKNVYVMMNLFAKDGAAKLVPSCTYPLTGLRCVRRVYTDHATFDIDSEAGTVRVRETFGIAVAELRSRVAVDLS